MNGASSEIFSALSRFFAAPASQTLVRIPRQVGATP
jgi:hypothetical protein